MRFINTNKKFDEHKKFLHILFADDSDFVQAKERVKTYLKFHKGDREEFLIDLVSLLVEAAVENKSRR